VVDRVAMPMLGGFEMAAIVAFDSLIGFATLIDFREEAFQVLQSCRKFL